MNQQQARPGAGGAAAAAPAATAGRTVMDRLKELSELKGAGLISDEEFASKKAELMKEL